MADDVRVSDQVRLAPDRLDSPIGVELATTLLAELLERYGAEDELDGLTADQLAPPHGSFIVAWLEDSAVGCGGLRRIDEQTAEIKRMYVRPTARRKGIALAMLSALEEAARELGYARVVLETGTKQPEAMQMYETHGYDSIEPYGAYRDSPMSRCYTKVL
jgi:GNAT superfamily N-acetyltransferase